MKPVLYAKGSSEWNTLGIGTLSDSVSCKVQEKRNGEYELELKYPIFGVHYNEIERGMLIKAKANDFSDLQLFKIYKISKPMKGQTTIKAEHISYELNGLPVPSLVLENTTPASAVNTALATSLLGSGGYTFWSNISTRSSITIRTPNSIRSILGGTKGSVLDVWGGEFEFDNKNIKLHRSRGTNRGVHIKYGRNLTDLKQEESIEQMYTHVFPFVRVTENDVETFVALQNNATIDLNTAASLGYTRCLQLDLTDRFESDEEISTSAILTKANAYIAENKLTTPTVCLNVSFYALRNSDEYKDMPTLERIQLCDTVYVDFEQLGVSAEAKVISTTYDVLLEKYDSIELGDVRSSFSETLRGHQQEIDAIKTQIVPQQISKATAIIDSQTKAFGEKMLNGLGLYSTTLNGVTYYHDTATLQDADYIITINSAGVAFAKTAGNVTAWNNGSPNFTYGVDADGGGILSSLLVRTIIADIITSGKLQSVDGKVYFDLDNALIHTETANRNIITNLSPSGLAAIGDYAASSINNHGIRIVRQSANLPTLNEYIEQRISAYSNYNSLSENEKLALRLLWHVDYYNEFMTGVLVTDSDYTGQVFVAPGYILVGKDIDSDTYITKDLIQTQQVITPEIISQEINAGILKAEVIKLPDAEGNNWVQVNDFIVDQGTATAGRVTWRWRKWASGRSDCVGRADYFAVNDTQYHITLSSDGQYAATAGSNWQVTFPGGLFAAGTVPTVLLTWNAGASVFVAAQTVQNDYFLPRYCTPIQGLYGQTIRGYLNIMASGVWRT